MAKSKVGNVIALEIEKYEAKINEFQNYLEVNKLTFYTGDEKYKEYDLQIKMLNALPNWLVSLKALKEDAEAKSIELRGGNEMSEVARLRGNIE